MDITTTTVEPNKVEAQRRIVILTNNTRCSTTPCVLAQAELLDRLYDTVLSLQLQGVEVSIQYGEDVWKSTEVGIGDTPVKKPPLESHLLDC